MITLSAFPLPFPQTSTLPSPPVETWPQAVGVAGRSLMLGGSACRDFAWDPLVTLFGKSVTLLEPEKQPCKAGGGVMVEPFPAYLIRSA